MLVSWIVMGHVDLHVDTIVLEKNTAFIFSPEDGGKVFFQNIGIYP
jgi:hypothetical protein